MKHVLVAFTISALFASTVFASGKGAFQMLAGAGAACYGLTGAWVPQSGTLSAYWNLNGTPGAIANGATIPATVGGATVNGTANTANLVYTNARVAQSITLDGASAISIPNSALLNTSSQMSFSLWMKASVMDGAARGILCKRTSSSQGDFCVFSFVSGSTPSLYVDIGGSGNRITSAALVANKWYHIVLVFDGSLATASRLKIYLNGSLATTGAISLSAIGSDTSPLLIGGMATNGNTAGLIDEVAIWKSALTLEQVKLIYDHQSCGLN